MLSTEAGELQLDGSQVRDDALLGAATGAVAGLAGYGIQAATTPSHLPDSTVRFDSRNFSSSDDLARWAHVETNDWTYINDTEYAWYGYDTERGVTVDHFVTSTKSVETIPGTGGDWVATKYEVQTFKNLQSGQEVSAYGHSHPPSEVGALGHDRFSDVDVDLYPQRQKAFGSGVRSYLSAGGEVQVMHAQGTSTLGRPFILRLSSPLAEAPGAPKSRR